MLPLKVCLKTVGKRLATCWQKIDKQVPERWPTGQLAGVAGAVGDWLGVWRAGLGVCGVGWLVLWLAVFTDGL